MNKEKKDYWYKDIVIYQIHVRSFFDSNQDGIGDFPGLISKLDYLEYLGINAIWLLPFYPSPLKDEGYDIADYKRVNPIYGNLNDFKHLVKEAHRRNIKIITELVINHTSNEHPWFKRAQLAPKGSVWRDYYTWSDHPDRYADARIIFKDFETSNWTWDPIAKAYYWHRFYAHQPDLNYENPKVHDEIFKIVDFWLGLGVDGMRLDAIPYLYQKEGTNCENLPETHAFLKKLHHYIDGKYPDRFLLAEANQWPEEAIQYFGDGDECQMAFHFPLMPRIFMAVQMEDKYPVVDIIEQTPPIPDNCQWAIFLRNHDELTLEMVTDEERDYMYRMYGQDPQMRINLGIRRRLAPLLNGDRRKIELLNILLFSLPGSPVLYYGDEIGMGDNIYLGDRNGVRTPMQWSNDSNAGFSLANPQKLFLPVIIDPEYSYQFVNVKLQQQNTQSLLFWVKRLISVRARYQALSQGSIRFLSTTNNKILAYIREYEGTKMVIVANLSRYTQNTHIDFSEFEHNEPLEVFGQNAFPRITQDPYFLVLAPYGYLWLELKDNQRNEQQLIEPPLKQVETIERFFKQHKLIEEALRAYLPSCRWFRSKNDKITQIRIIDQFEMKKSQTYLFLLNIDFAHQRPENYFIALHASDDEPDNKPYLLKINTAKNKHYYLIEAEHSPTAMGHLFLQFRTKKTLNGLQGKMTIHANSFAQKIVDNTINPEDLTPLSKEQSNTSVAFKDQAILKIFRLQEEGENPEVEISTQLKNFKEHISAKIAAVIDYETEQKKSTVAIINEYISNEGTAWDLSVNLLEHALEQIHFNAEDLPEEIIFPWNKLMVPPNSDEELGVYREIVKKLAQKTASMHLLLASIKEKNFVPESFTLFDQRSMYQGLNHLLNKTAKKLSTVHQQFVFNSAPLAQYCKQLLHTKLGGKKIRCHGDYHLGQILYTGMDFIIIDYEGEPVRAVSERKLKRSPLKDVAGMLRSFHYVLHKLHQEKSLDTKAMDYLYSNLCQRFMQEYLKEAHILLPEKEEDIAQLLRGFMMEKTLYEIIYEIDNRPDWISIPYHGLHYLL